MTSLASHVTSQKHGPLSTRTCAKRAILMLLDPNGPRPDDRRVPRGSGHWSTCELLCELGRHFRPRRHGPWSATAVTNHRSFFSSLVASMCFLHDPVAVSWAIMCTMSMDITRVSHLRGPFSLVASAAFTFFILAASASARRCQQAHAYPPWSCIGEWSRRELKRR